MILAFAASFALTALFVPLAVKLSKKLRAVDMPGGRKIHKRPTYRLGGLAIFLSFFIVLGFYALPSSGPQLFYLPLIPCLIVFVGGLLDDIYDLKPIYKLLFVLFGAFFAARLGLAIANLNIPGVGLVELAFTQIQGISIGGVLAIIWLTFIANTVNLSDGLDGLAAGLVGITAIILALLSYFNLHQTFLAGIFAILAGASLGFLPFNFYPAKIFMGDSGALFLGFILGILAILSGAKILTAVLVLGFPILDLGWSVVRRFSRHGFKGIFKADREHLHHMLLDAGMSQRQVVIFYYFISALFGVFALFGDTKIKLLSFSVLVLMTIGILGLLIFWLKKNKRWRPT